MITSNKWLATLNANNPLVSNGNNGAGSAGLPTGLTQPLDLSLAAMASAGAFGQQHQQPTIQSCSDCKELRKEVRDVKTSLQALIHQFNAFAGRWGPLNQVQPEPESSESSEKNHHHRPSSAIVDSKSSMDPNKDSPPSSLSSVEWGGEIPGIHPKESTGSSSPSSGTDGRNKLSSPDSATSGDSLGGVSGAKKRKLSFQPTKSTTNSNLHQMGSHLNSTGLKPSSHHTNPYLAAAAAAAAQQAHMNSMLSGLQSTQNGADPYLPLLHSQLLGNNAATNPSAFSHLQHLLMGWQNLAAAGGKSADILGGMSSNPFHGHAGLSTGVLSGGLNHLSTAGGGTLAPDRSVSSSSNQSPIGVVTSGSGDHRDHQSSSAASFHLENLVKKSKLAQSPLSHNYNEKELCNGNRKKPGPDDFIKEFVEHPEIDVAEPEAERPLQIPVPEAFESDPDFRPVSEEEILGSTKWEELEWQEAVTRLAKKLAERRVFGPMLMAKATVAGTNHSNYPNLPMDGILYIESVCRRTLFPQMSRRQFAEFFRPAVKGLAARCRRIRHSLKPNNGNSSFLLNQSSASLEDTSFSELSPTGNIVPIQVSGTPPAIIKEEVEEGNEGVIDPNP